jgi:hypothetical protein
VEDLTKYEGQAITLLSPSSKIKVKWAASSSSIAREIEAEVLCFSVGTGLHGVRYIEDSLFETVNLIHPTSRRPMWKWLSLPVGMQSPAPAEGEGCDQTGSYPSQNEMTQLKKSGYQLHFGSPGQPVAMIKFVDSPAVAGLDSDMSDDTVVDSDMPPFIISYSDSDSE